MDLLDLGALLPRGIEGERLAEVRLRRFTPARAQVRRRQPRIGRDRLRVERDLDREDAGRALEVESPLEHLLGQIVEAGLAARRSEIAARPCG